MSCQEAYTAKTYPRFHRMKQQGVFLPPPSHSGGFTPSNKCTSTWFETSTVREHPLLHHFIYIYISISWPLIFANLPVTQSKRHFLLLSETLWFYLGFLELPNFSNQLSFTLEVQNFVILLYMLSTDQELSDHHSIDMLGNTPKTQLSWKIILTHW